MTYTHVALTRELSADLDTPVGAYLKLASGPYSFVLESMVGGERWGRYSFIGLPSREVLTARGNALSISRDGAVVETAQAADPLDWIRGYAARRRVKPDATLPRFSGGLVGYFGYDCVRYFEPRLAAKQQPDPIGTPDILLMLADELVVFDNQRATLTIITHARAGDAADEARARRRLDEIETQLNTAAPQPRTALSKDASDLDFVSCFGEEPFKQAVQRIQEYIAAGDCMQVVPSQRLTAPLSATPVSLYRAIRRLNPSPYLYCMDLGDHHVVGSSPEILVRVDHSLDADGVVVSELTVRPIAGTRKRGANEAEDRALETDLLADPKELAEHLMLIDLGRNDVGRVSATGSVRLTERMAIERYSHVMHIVSNVTGKLKPGLDALDALAATFPAGTLSGAPKVRAMEIIDEVEPVKRGIFGGAIGYLGWDGNMDTAIAIRTAVIKDGQVHVQAGAGIVADSVPQSEWDETMTKARAMMKAAAQAQGAQSCS